MENIIDNGHSLNMFSWKVVFIESRHFYFIYIDSMLLSFYERRRKPAKQKYSVQIEIESKYTAVIG